jgi:hypothetical protein
MALAVDDPAVRKSLGQVVRLPCKFIKGKSDTQPIVIRTIAQELSATGKNILPVIVRSLGEDKYQAILNTQIVEAARQAKLDFVWCIVVNQSMQTQIEVELGKVLRVNVAIAPESELIDTLKYIQAHKPGFNKINPEKVASAIVEYRKANKISNLNFLSKAKCGVGKAKIAPLAENLVIS